MKQYIGKKVYILVDVKGQSMHYNCEVLEVNNTHVSILDKFNQKYTFRIIDIIEIREEKEQS